MVDDIATDADWNALYIDGERTESESGESIAVENSLTRETAAHVPRETEVDVDAAYEAAAEAQESWVEVPPTRRQEVVEQSLQVLDRYEDETIDLLAYEAGGSCIMGETSIRIASDHTSEAAILPRRIRGRYAASNIPGKGNIVQKNPKDVVTVISSWNFPPNLLMWAVAPAVTVGNVAVLKPSISSPITSGLLFAELFEETDPPKGTVSAVTDYGSEIDDRAAGHPESNVIVFTGPIEVGKHVSGIADENLAMSAMELGDNNVHAVTEGADADRTADATIFRSSIHQGQARISINRYIVHEPVYDGYVEKLAEWAAKLPVSSAHKNDTAVGPIIDKPQHDEMPGYIGETVAAGATLEISGLTADPDGVGDLFVVQLTVLPDVANDTAAARNEYFGLIASIIPFSNVDEVVEPANATRYDFSGPVHVGGLATDKEITLRVKTGSVRINNRPTNDEVYVPFSSIGVSGAGTCNSDAFLDGITEDKWISPQHEPYDYPP